MFVRLLQYAKVLVLWSNSRMDIATYFSDSTRLFKVIASLSLINQMLWIPQFNTLCSKYYYQWVVRMKVAFSSCTGVAPTQLLSAPRTCIYEIIFRVDSIDQRISYLQLSPQAADTRHVLGTRNVYAVQSVWSWFTVQLIREMPANGMNVSVWPRRSVRRLNGLWLSKDARQIPTQIYCWVE